MTDAAAPFASTRHGRRATTALAVVAVYLGVLFLWAQFEASAWIVAPLLLVTLPAVWDLISNPVSHVWLDADGLRWQTGSREGHIDLAWLARVRFDTTWDFAVRITMILENDKRITLPPDCKPPHQAFEAALQAHGVATERHHFALWSRR
ncbi:MAG: hypothetical protein AAGF74_18240 [Pseudomonadota bacterium]